LPIRESPASPAGLSLFLAPLVEATLDNKFCAGRTFAPSTVVITQHFRSTAYITLLVRNQGVCREEVAADIPMHDAAADDDARIDAITSYPVEEFIKVGLYLDFHAG
jgi:hypothetical protein